MNWVKILFILPLLIFMYSCLEPFTATVGDNAAQFLVVDGIISNENIPHKIKLARSISNIDQQPIPESGAKVSIEDNMGNKTEFLETEPGIYETNTNTFQGIPGRIYTLIIRTKDRNIYQSEPCYMQPPSQIDNIYYVPGNNPDSLSNNKNTGLRMFINGQINVEEVEYLRWAYREDWQFQIPFGYDEVPTPEGGWIQIEPKKYCWKSEFSSKIITQSLGNQSQKKIENKELFFIDSKNTDKLFLRYRARINQYSISKEEFEFWRKLEQTNPETNNIFGEQPFTIRGNIKNIDYPDEHVLGYFSVAGCATKELYINYSEIRHLQLPINDYYNTCSFDSLMFDNLNMNAWEVYENYVLNEYYNYELAFAIIPQNSFSTVPIGLAVSTPQCCDCSLQGDLNPPDFWVND